jgi:hypothetical protein
MKEEVPMDEPQTCGKGLADNSVLPAKLAELMAGLGENLEVHMEALDLSDENGRQEQQAYRQLAGELRAIAARMTAVASRMAGYRDLPMGKHDQQAMLRPAVRQAFEKFVRSKQELLALLRTTAEADERILGQMAG